MTAAPAMLRSARSVVRRRGDDESGAPESVGLSIRHLGVSYGRLPALVDVSLDVAAGSCVAVLGPNGAGKTSLLDAISGAVRPVSGAVTLDGDRIERRPAHAIRLAGVCHVPEGRGVLPGLSVAENLRLAIPDLADRNRALETFPRLGERLSQRVGTMSGGEQQMLALASALGRQHRLLLVDEVSLGLAPLLVEELYTVLGAIRATGVTIVLVEQFAERALALADEVVVLVKGRVAHRGPAADLRNDGDRLSALYLGGAR